jgi:H+-transporting ATPase
VTNTVMMQTTASKSETREDLKAVPLGELRARLGSSPDGPSQAEATGRLAEYGYNEITEKQTSAFLKF